MSQELTTNNDSVMNTLVEDLSDEIVKTVRVILRTEDINFTGGLSDKILQYKSGRFNYIVFNSLYAEFVEDGMPPGQNIDKAKLREWVRKKIGITDESTLTTVTDRIFNKITDEGIEPKRFLSKALDSVVKQWEQK